MQITEALALSREDAAVTARYLKELSDRFPSPGIAVQSLFGRLCLASAGADVRLDTLEAEATVLCDGLLHHHEPEQLDLDVLLMIESHRMLKEAGMEPASVRELVTRIASELLAQPVEAQRLGRIRHMASVLSSLGLPARIAKPAPEMARLLRSPENWFGISVGQLADLANHLIADGRPLDDHSTRILSLLALAELRNYRVDLGCTLLRAAFQLGEPCLESTEAFHFIALQRRRDGRYGFPNQFVEAAVIGIDQHRTLYLPLTVNAVWLFRARAERFQPQAIAVGA